MSTFQKAEEIVGIFLDVEIRAAFNYSKPNANVNPS